MAEKKLAFIHTLYHKPEGAPSSDLPLTKHLEPEFIYGCSKRACKGNFLLTNKNGNLVYPAAGCGVTYDVANNSQKIFSKHDDDVICVSMHPDGVTVATGQIGKNDMIYVYNSETLEILAELKTYTTFTNGGVLALSFSSDGSKLITIGGSPMDSSLLIFDWKTATIVAKCKASKTPIYSLGLSPKDEIYIVGKNVVKYATFSGSEITMRNCIHGNRKPENVYCVTFGKDGFPYCGSQSGDLLVFQGNALSRAQKGHTNSIYCLNSLRDGGFLTGGKDGKVLVWSAHAQSITHTFDLKSPVRSVVQSVSDDYLFYACMDNGDFVKVSINTGQVSVVLKGHNGLDELWALDELPHSNFFVSGGDDGRIIIWDKSTRKFVNEVRVKGKVRSVGCSPDRKQIAAGTIEGSFYIFNTDDIIAHGRTANSVHHIVSGKEELSVIKYSPNGKYLAVGSHDNFIRVYNTEKNYTMHGKPLSAHTSYICTLDWSEDSHSIQSVCGAYELLYWNVENCHQEKSGQIHANTKWHTQTCKLGWGVRGIWNMGMYNDGTDINMVDVNFKLSLLAVADDLSLVSLLSYPTATMNPPRQKYRGHCSHVTNLKFTSDNAHLLSSGGGDLTIIQHRIVDGDPKQ